MQAVKALVIGLGILLLAGVALLVYGISQKAADPKFKLFESQAAKGTALAPFGETRIPLPEGCSVAEIRPDGDRLYVRTTPPGPCERIIIVDAASGRVLGSLWLRP